MTTTPSYLIDYNLKLLKLNLNINHHQKGEEKQKDKKDLSFYGNLKIDKRILKNQVKNRYGVVIRQVYKLKDEIFFRDGCLSLSPNSSK